MRAVVVCVAAIVLLSVSVVEAVPLIHKRLTTRSGVGVGAGANALHAHTATVGAWPTQACNTIMTKEDKGVILRQDTKFKTNPFLTESKEDVTLNELLSFAAGVQPTYVALLQAFVREGRHLKKAPAAVIAVAKGAVSAKKKSEEYKTKEGDADPDLRLIDLSRGSMVFKSEEELKAGVCEFLDFIPMGFGSADPKTPHKWDCRIERIKNRWDKPIPSGYRDVMITASCLWDVKGQVRRWFFEVQFHLCSHLMMKDASVDEINRVLSEVAAADKSMIPTEADQKLDAEVRATTARPNDKAHPSEHFVSDKKWSFSRSSHGFYEIARSCARVAGAGAAAAKTTIDNVQAVQRRMHALAEMASVSEKCDMTVAKWFDLTHDQEKSKMSWMVQLDIEHDETCPPAASPPAPSPSPSKPQGPLQSYIFQFVGHSEEAVLSEDTAMNCLHGKKRVCGLQQLPPKRIVKFSFAHQWVFATDTPGEATPPPPANAPPKPKVCGCE